MQMYSKLITVILSLLMCTSLISCKKTEDPDNKTAKPASTNIVAHKGVDLKGTTIRVLNPEVKKGNGAEPYKDKGYLGTVMMQRINDIQKNYNCKIQFIGNSNYNGDRLETVNSILQGEPNCEIAKTSDEYIVYGIENGGLYQVLNDYDDILELDNANIWDVNSNKEYFTFDGLTTAIVPVLRGYQATEDGYFMYFNKSMLKKEGLWSTYNLYDMQKNKTWTWDVLDKIGKAVTKDTDGDGKTDQYGLLYNGGNFNSFNASNLVSGNQVGVVGLRDGKAVFFGREKSQMTVLNFFLKSGKKGAGWYIAPNFGQRANEGPREVFTKGKTAFNIDPGNAIKLLKDAKMKDTFGVVATPLGPDNSKKEYYMSRQSGMPWTIVSAVSDSQSKAAAYVLRELAAPLFSKEESDLGTESILFDYIGGEEQILETFKMLSEPERAAISSENPFIGTWKPAIASYRGEYATIIENGLTPDTLNKTWGDSLQNEINKFWSQVMEGLDLLKEDRKNEGK